MITPAEAAKEMLARKKGRKNLIDFTQYTYPKYRAEPFHHALAAALDKTIRGETARLMVFAPPQHGKLCAHDTPVFTPKGWMVHGFLRPGDYVLGRDGKPVQVLAISEDGIADRVIEFTDGARIQCNSRHEWMVFDRSKHRPVEMCKETDEMRDSWLGERCRGGRAGFQVDTNVLISFPGAEFEIPPYVLGMWLGDGTSSGNCITHHADDGAFIERFAELGLERTGHSVHKVTGVHVSHFRVLYGMLKRAGLLNNKHIPTEYLCASVEQRLGLLAGLLDSDGYVYRQNGRTVFTGTDPVLVDNVKTLILSLGWRATVSEIAPCLSSSGIQGKKAVYQLSFNPTMNIPVALERKRNTKLNPAIRKRGIRSIRECDPVSGRCIQVEGGIYLVGPTLIPTHNSELVSRRLPAFWLGRRPNDPIVLTSYASGLAESMSRDARNIVESTAYQTLFPDVKTDTSSRAVSNWRIGDHRGVLIAAGVGGGITGHGALLGIIDDPVEKWEHAQSRNARDKIWDWYRSTFYSRVWDEGVIIVVQTRWHEDDLSGRLLIDQGKDWTILRFAALAESQEDRDEANRLLWLPEGQPDPLGREEGEALCPLRFKQERLEETRDKNGPTIWSALYQGCPRAHKGGYFEREWFEPYLEKVPEKYDVLVRYWDKGSSTSKRSPFSCGVLIGRLKSVYYVLDVVRGKWDVGMREAKIREVALRDTMRWGYVRIWIEQEPGSGGKESAQATIKNLSGFTIRADRVTGQKDVRIEPFAAQAKIRNVKVLRAHWNWDYFEELTSFPSSTFKDQVDATSGAFNKIAVSGVFLA